jgi:hypothetical protein
MKSTGKLLPVLGLTALAVCARQPAAAAAVLDEAALLRSADLVFAGVVEKVEYAFSDARGGKRPRTPHTFVTYRIEDVLRGHAPGETITLRFIGGRGEQASFLLASELPLFDIGDRDVLFVSGNTVSGCPLVGCAEGRLRVIQDRVFNDEGQAVELDADGRVVLGSYYDLPEVMTHEVSQTVLARRDHFEHGESREEYKPGAVGTQLGEPELLGRLRSAARSAPEAIARVASADVAQPFVLDPFLAEPAPADRADATASASVSTAQERAEVAAMSRSGADPVIGNSVK